MSRKMSSNSDARRKPKWCLQGFPPVILMVFASCLIWSENVRWVAADSEMEDGFCAPYQGTICRSFIRSSQVWFSRVNLNYGWENEMITAGLWEEMMPSLPKLCRDAAEVRSFAVTYNQAFL